GPDKDKRGPGYDASAAADSAGNSPKFSIAKFPSYLASSTANAGDRVAKPATPPKLNRGELLNLTMRPSRKPRFSDFTRIRAASGERSVKWGNEMLSPAIG